MIHGGVIGNKAAEQILELQLVLKAGLGCLGNSRCTESPGKNGLCRPAGKGGFGHTSQPWLSSNPRNL